MKLAECAYAMGWGTHLPLLASVVAVARPGPILELGVGYSSSPMLEELCRAMGRDLDQIDSDPKWAVQFDAGYVSSWVEWDPDPSTTWSVAFVDLSPGTSRLPVVRKLRDRCEFIVVHDTDNAAGDVPDLHPFLKTFPHIFVYDRMRPWTTVVSDLRCYPGGGR